MSKARVFNFDAAWSRWTGQKAVTKNQPTDIGPTELYKIDGVSFTAAPYWTVISAPSQLHSRVALNVDSDPSRGPILATCVKQATLLLARILVHYVQQRLNKQKLPEWNFGSALYNVLYVRSAGLLSEAASCGKLDILENFLGGLHNQRTEDGLLEYLTGFAAENPIDDSISCQFTGVELNWQPEFTSPQLPEPHLGPLVPRALHSDGCTIISECGPYEVNTKQTRKVLQAKVNLLKATA